MQTDATAQNKKHTLLMEQRSRMQLTGVSDVQSFDEQSVVLTTDCGELCVEGEGLHVSTLDIARGLVDIDGQISCVAYSEAGSAKKSRRMRLFG